MIELTDATDGVWFTKPEIFTLWPFIEKVLTSDVGVRNYHWEKEERLRCF